MNERLLLRWFSVCGDPIRNSPAGIFTNFIPILFLISFLTPEELGVPGLGYSSFPARQKADEQITNSPIA